MDVPDLTLKVPAALLIACGAYVAVTGRALLLRPGPDGDPRPYRLLGLSIMACGGTLLLSPAWDPARIALSLVALVLAILALRSTRRTRPSP